MRDEQSVISRFGFEGGNLVPIALFPAYVLLMIYFPKDITILHFIALSI